MQIAKMKSNQIKKRFNGSGGSDSMSLLQLLLSPAVDVCVHTVYMYVRKIIIPTIRYCTHYIICYNYIRSCTCEKNLLYMYVNVQYNMYNIGQWIF